MGGRKKGGGRGGNVRPDIVAKNCPDFRIERSFASQEEKRKKKEGHAQKTDIEGKPQENFALGKLNQDAIGGGGTFFTSYMVNLYHLSREEKRKSFRRAKRGGGTGKAFRFSESNHARGGM